jgi:hypothetical protein
MPTTRAIDLWFSIQRHRAELSHEIGRLDTTEGGVNTHIQRQRVLVMLADEIDSLTDLRARLLRGDWLTVPF